MTGYTGAIHFSSGDGAALLPADYQFVVADNGVRAFAGGVTLKTAGGQTVDVTDAADNTLTGSLSLTVNAAAPQRLVFAPPLSVMAGAAFTATLTAQDQFNNTATGYGGSVHFSSSDGAATLPGNYSFTPTDAGQRSFSFTLRTEGSRTLTVTDVSLAGALPAVTATLDVGAGAATHFSLSAPATATSGTPFDVRVTALDANNNAVTDYAGAIHFSSSDAAPGVALPADYTFDGTPGGDGGVHTFNLGATLITAGNRIIGVAEVGNAAVSGGATVNVDAGQAAHFTVSGPPSVIAGVPFDVTVTALDGAQNLATLYRGAIAFTSGDALATLPANYHFSATDNGVHTFSGVTRLRTAGSQTLGVSDASSNAAGSTSVQVNTSVVSLTPASFSGTEGAATGTVTLASFTDTGCTSASDYTAAINWGDNSASAGAVSGACSGSLTVAASHIYGEEGTLHPVVTVTKLSSGGVASATATATIADAPISVAGGFTLSGVEGAALTAQTVATFSDSAGPEPAANYAVTIDWGDGTPTTTGAITANGNVLAVAGTHTYAEEGAYTIHITGRDDGGATATATSSAFISDAALTGTGKTVGPVEGAAFSGAVATVSDAGGLEAPDKYTVTIAWGDGTPTAAGSVSVNGQSLNVNGTHTYTEEGSYTLTITVTDEGGSTTTITSTATVDDAPLHPAARTLTPTEGAVFSGVVATFSDAGGAEPAGNYSATIVWGDNTPQTAGAISVNGGTFSVSGEHTYAEEGDYAITVNISDEGGSAALVASTALVGDAALHATVPPAPAALAPIAGILWSGPVASFTDSDPGAVVGLYAATINWGDGAPTSAGTLTAGSNGVFTVSGTHTYAAAGEVTVSVTVTDAGGSTVTITVGARVELNCQLGTCREEINPPPPTATPAPTVAPPTPTIVVPTLTPVVTATPAASATPGAPGTATPTATSTATSAAGGNTPAGGGPSILVLDGVGAPPAMLLTAGCNQATLGSAANTPLAAIAALVSPSEAAVAIWRFNNATKAYESGYFADRAAPTDFAVTSGAEGSYFICVTGDATIGSTVNSQ